MSRHEEQAKSWINLYEEVQTDEQHPTLRYLLEKDDLLYFVISSDDDIVSTDLFLFTIDVSDSENPRIGTLKDGYNKTPREIKWLNSLVGFRGVIEILSAAAMNYRMLTEGNDDKYEKIIEHLIEERAEFRELLDRQIIYRTSRGYEFIIDLSTTLPVVVYTEDGTGKHIRTSGIVIQSGLTAKTWNLESLVNNLENLSLTSPGRRSDLLETDISLLDITLENGVRAIVGKPSEHLDTNVVFASPDQLQKMRKDGSLRSIVVESENGMKTCCTVSSIPLLTKGEISLSMETMKNLDATRGQYCSFQSVSLPHVKECFFSVSGREDLEDLTFLDRYPVLTSGEVLSNGLLVEKMLDHNDLEIIMGRLYDSQEETIITFL